MRRTPLPSTSLFCKGLIKGAWVLRHPDLLEDAYRITVYEENGIVTALTGYILP